MNAALRAFAFRIWDARASTAGKAFAVRRRSARPSARRFCWRGGADCVILAAWEDGEMTHNPAETDANPRERAYPARECGPMDRMSAEEVRDKAMRALEYLRNDALRTHLRKMTPLFGVRYSLKRLKTAGSPVRLYHGDKEEAAFMEALEDAADMGLIAHWEPYEPPNADALFSATRKSDGSRVWLVVGSSPSISERCIERAARRAEIMHITFVDPAQAIAVGYSVQPAEAIAAEMSGVDVIIVNEDDV